MQNMIVRPAKRKQFNMIRSVAELGKLMDGLPDDECFKFLSDGGFSSVSFVKFVANHTAIKELTASTLRVGKKELQQMDFMYKAGRLKAANFIIGSVMKNDSKAGLKYGYYDNFESVCKKNGWRYAASNNHSKVILFDTDAGKYVLETSSNLNENPKMEQFSFEKDAALFEFYRKNMIELLGGDDNGKTGKVC